MSGKGGEKNDRTSHRRGLFASRKVSNREASPLQEDREAGGALDNVPTMRREPTSNGGRKRKRESQTCGPVTTAQTKRGKSG